MRLDLSIDIVSDISEKDFNEYYFKKQRPLIIRKALLNEQPLSKSWSLDFFKKNYGDILVDVFDNKNLEHKKSAVFKPDLKMKFSDFIEIIQKDEHTDLRMFLFNLYKEIPELKKQFACPKIAKGILGNIGFTFFGGKDTDVKMHYDIDMSCVFLTQFEGRKRVVLFDPSNSELLYRLPYNLHTLVDINKPDYHKYPGLKYVRGYDFVMQPGDTLFMPSGWWHYNTYLEGGFAVAYRRLSPDLTTMILGLKNLLFMIPFDKLMIKFFGDTWFEWKKKESERIANYRIRQIENNRVYSAVSN